LIYDYINIAEEDWLPVFRCICNIYFIRIEEKQYCLLYLGLHVYGRLMSSKKYYSFQANPLFGTSTVAVRYKSEVYYNYTRS